MKKDYSIRCKFCDILLIGREQFIGHMYHSHEMEYERLKAAWQSLFFNNGRNDTVAWHRGQPPRRA